MVPQSKAGKIFGRVQKNLHLPPPKALVWLEHVTSGPRHVVLEQAFGVLLCLYLMWKILL